MKYIFENESLYKLVESDSLEEFLDSTAPEYKKVVPIHWLQHERPSRSVQFALSIVLLLICIVANSNQVLVFIAFGRRLSLRSASNRLLISLLAADFLLLVNGYQVVIQNLVGSPIFGVTGCNFYGFNASTAALAEIWSLAFVTLDRVLSICYPLDRSKRISKSQANRIILIVWGSAAVWSVFPLIGWNKYVSESYFMGCAFDSFSTSWRDRSYILVLLVLCWLLPSVHNLAGYIIMMKKLRNSNIFQFISPNAPRHRSRLLNSTKRIEMEITMTKMVCKILLIWFMSWSPYAILSIWTMFLDHYKLSPVIAVVPTICTKGSAFANAMVYGINLPKFNSEVKTMFKSGKNSILNKCAPRTNVISRSYDTAISPTLPQKQQSNRFKDIVISYPSYQPEVVEPKIYGSKEEKRFTSNLEDDKSICCSSNDMTSKLKRSNAFRNRNSRNSCNSAYTSSYPAYTTLTKPNSMQNSTSRFEKRRISTRSISHRDIMVKPPNTWVVTKLNEKTPYICNIGGVRPSVVLYKFSAGGIMNSYNCSNAVIRPSIEELYTEDQMKTSTVSLLPEVFGNVDFPFIDEELE